MTCILDRWFHLSKAPSSEKIIPDGCRDIIVVRPHDGPVQCFLSELQTEPRFASINAGCFMTGFRIKPGVHLNEARIISEISDRCIDFDEIAHIIEENSHTCGNIDEAVRCLSTSGYSTAKVAQDIGVSRRSLQRLFRRRTLPPPEFWLLLARARRAAALIDKEASLSEIAYAEGYSDQAHMTRDFQRWFHLSPGQLRRDQGLQGMVRQSGLGVASTGEQISTR